MALTSVSDLTSSYAAALQAAQQACAKQNYPLGVLYMVATPIGNLADISLRALAVLQLADVVACEDTRHTQALLRAYGIDKANSQLLAVHEHNEVQAAQNVLARLQDGLRVAYVSDAGTPAVSDPGARLVAVVRAGQYRVIPLPGASSVTAVLSAAGIANDTHQKGFVFAGFLSSKATERAHQIQALVQESRATVVLEAPHRIEALALALTVLGTRQVTVGRELTKQFEEVATVTASELAGWLRQDVNRLRGEFALVLHPSPVATPAGEAARVLQLLLAELPLKTAVRLAADITGEPRNALYALALELKAA